MNTHFQDGFAELTDRQRKIYDVERLLLIALLHGEQSQSKLPSTNWAIAK